MKKSMIFSFISIYLLLTSCSFEQDPLASFPLEIRDGILPGDNRVLKPIPRGVIQVEGVPESPLVFHNEVSVIGVSVRLLQSFQAPYVVEVLNLSTLPGEANFNSKTNKITWTPDLSKLQSLFEYIPIKIRVSFQEPQPLYVEHTIYVRSYRQLQGLKLQNYHVNKFVAGSSKLGKITIVVKDLDFNLKISGKKANAPHIMLTQGNKPQAKYLLPYLKGLVRPKLKNWRDTSVWILEAQFDLKRIQLKKGEFFYFNYEVFSSFGKSFGLKTEKIFIEKTFVAPKPPQAPRIPKIPKAPKIPKTPKPPKSPKTPKPVKIETNKEGK